MSKQICRTKNETKIYGYARISTKKQTVQRQIDNIKAAYPDAIVVQEEFTGATTDRPVINSLVDQLQEGDTVVFDEASRMSRNAEEGIGLYIELFDKGINLVFLKEPHINTEVYRSKINNQIHQMESDTGSYATNKLISAIFDALREYTIALAKEQIELAFKTAQAELDYIHKRTREGVKRAKERYAAETVEGKPHMKKLPGRPVGYKYVHKSEAEKKEKILKYSKSFYGSNTDTECMKLIGIARNTFYKYKRELKDV